MLQKNRDYIISNPLARSNKSQTIKIDGYENEATLQLPESQQVPVVLFTGNFNYDLEAESGSEKLDKLQKIFTNWHTDLENYQDVVNKFLQADDSYDSELENELELIPAMSK